MKRWFVDCDGKGGHPEEWRTVVGDRLQIKDGCLMTYRGDVLLEAKEPGTWHRVLLDINSLNSDDAERIAGELADVTGAYTSR